MKKAILILTIVVMLVTMSIAMLACDKAVDLKDIVFDDEVKALDATMAEGANIRVMSYNIQVSAWGGKNRGTPKERAKKYEQMVCKFLPDVIALQEVCENWHMNFTATTKANYKVMFNLLTNYTSMAYNVNTTELLEKGIVKYSKHNEKVIQMMRYIAYGVFKDKETGKTYVVTSTHLDFHPNEEIMELQVNELGKFVKDIAAKYENAPIFACGDYNVLEKADPKEPASCTEIYNKIAPTTGLVDANYIEGIETYFGDVQKIDDPKWDKIFVNCPNNIKKFGLLSFEYFKKVSDHYAIYVDVQI